MPVDTWLHGSVVRYGARFELGDSPASKRRSRVRRVAGFQSSADSGDAAESTALRVRSIAGSSTVL